MCLIHKDFIFIHVPKTAGNSLKTMLINAYKEKQEKVFLLTDYNGKGENAHIYLENIPFNTADKFTFCFVRNPWKQRVSWYLYHVRKGMCASDLGFKDFLVSRPIFAISNYLKCSDMDAIYRLEDFPKALEDLEVQLDIKLSKDKRIAVAPEPYDYTTYYDEETIEGVRRKESLLLGMFPYKFGDDV
jgi:hypothetical protein